MAAYAPERSDFLPSWEISISSSFASSPTSGAALQAHATPGGGIIPAGMKPSLFIFAPLITVRAGHGGSRAELPGWSWADPCQAHTVHSTSPVTSVPPCSLLHSLPGLLLWLLGSKTPASSDYLSIEALNSLGDGADRGGEEGGVALSAQGGTGWRKMIYTCVYSLSETQQDRDRWAQEQEHLGSDLKFWPDILGRGAWQPTGRIRMDAGPGRVQGREWV